MKEETGISVTAIQKLLDQLISRKYVERGEKDGSWRGERNDNYRL